jgi:tripartite-type tricarboxylate transporter receptor subunit TctC
VRDSGVPGFEASTFFGLGAPKNTPTEIIDKLNKEINAALADPKIKARLADMGATVLPGSPADRALDVGLDSHFPVNWSNWPVEL